MNWFFPWSFHEGHGKASSYIGHKGDDLQLYALSKTIIGEAGGGVFCSVYGSITEEF